MSGLEREDPPRMRRSRLAGLHRRSISKLYYYFAPEGHTVLVALGHADGPLAGKPLPNEVCRRASDAGSPIPSQDEEFRDVHVAGRFARNEGESGELVAVPNQEGQIAMGLFPVARQPAITES